MPVKAFLNRKFNNTHENIIFDELINRLKSRWDNSNDLVVIIGNFYYNNKEIDAMLIKSDSIIIIDFKDYAGKITFSENSVWTADGIVVAGGALINPFVQLRSSKGILSNFFKDKSEEIFQEKNKKITYYDIYSMVIFHRTIELTKQLPNELKKWFFITDIGKANQTISNITNQNLFLEESEILKIPELLEINEYTVELGIKSEQCQEKKLTQFSKDNSTSQNEAILKINEFIKSFDYDVFLLKGAAGTGKTYLIKEIVNLIIQNENLYFKVLAPTGKAVKNIKEKNSIENITTVHSLIYKRTPKENIKDKEENGTDETKIEKVVFELKENTDIDNYIYIVDESSLISDNKHSNEFLIFGSELLLTDLIEYTKIKEKKNKIIFIGDDYQITRGNQDLSALSENYLHKRFGLNTDSFELIDIVRQSWNNPIIKEAIKIRDAIKNKKFNYLEIKSDGNYIKKLENHNQVSEYQECINKDGIIETAVIKYSNKQVKTSNEKIREGVFRYKDSIQQGDTIMFYRNYFKNDDIFISNGEIGKVLKVYNREEPIKVNNKKKELIATLQFIDIEIEIFPYRNLRIKILENFLNSESPELQSNEIQALIIHFKQNNKVIINGKEKEPTPKTCGSAKEYYKKLMQDPYFNCALVKYAYSITGHKSQGSEWNNVFVDFYWQNAENNFKEQYFRWIYTAITRAKKNIYLIRPVTITPFKKLNWNFNNHQPDVIPLPANQVDIKDDLSIQNNSDLLYFYENLNEKITQDGILISNIVHNQWLEQVFFVKEENYVVIGFNYNKEGFFSFAGLQRYNSIELLDLIDKILKELKNQ